MSSECTFVPGRESGRWLLNSPRVFFDSNKMMSQDVNGTLVVAAKKRRKESGELQICSAQDHDN